MGHFFCFPPFSIYQPKRGHRNEVSVIPLSLLFIFYEKRRNQHQRDKMDDNADKVTIGIYVLTFPYHFIYSFAYVEQWLYLTQDLGTIQFFTLSV